MGAAGDPAVRQQLPGIIEQHDTVAKQASSSLGMGSHDAGGVVIGFPVRLMVRAEASASRRKELARTTLPGSLLVNVDERDGEDL